MFISFEYRRNYKILYTFYVMVKGDWTMLGIVLENCFQRHHQVTKLETSYKPFCLFGVREFKLYIT